MQMEEERNLLADQQGRIPKPQRNHRTKDTVARLKAFLEDAKAILETVREPLLALDENIRIMFANPAFYATFHVLEKDVRGKILYELGNNQWNIAELRALLEDTRSNKKEFQDYEIAHDFPTLGKKILFFTTRSIVEKQVILLAIEDVTDRKQVQEKIQRERQQLLNLFMQAPAAIGVTRGENHIQEFTNPLYMKLVGKRENLVGKSVREMFPELEGQGFFELLDTVYQTGKPFFGNEMPIKWDIRGDGTFVENYLNFIYQPLTNENGCVTGIMTHAIDVTTQVKARQKSEQLAFQVEQQAKTFDTVLTTVSDLIYTFDTSGRFTYANKRVLDLLGLTFQQIIGKNFYELPYPKDLASTLHAHIDSVIRTEKPIIDETPFMSPSGIPGYYEYIFAPVFDKTGIVTGVVGSTRDITKRKQAEEDQQRLSALVENSVDFIAISEMNGKGLFLNPAGQKLIGLYGQEAVQRINMVDCFPVDERLFIEEHVIPMVLKNGSWTGETRVQNFITGKIIPVTWNAFVINDAKTGKPTGLGCISQDITERKRLERQKDDFIGIASHELKTPVTSIKAFTQILQKRFAQAGDEKSTLLLGKMDTQINKLTSLIGDLLDATKLEGGQLQFNEDFFSLDAIVDEIVEELQRTTSKHIIEREGKAEGTLYGDGDRIGQVVTNLLTNAIKYSPHSERILVKIAEDTKQVTLCVQDFGIGIPKEMQVHLFERFYRVGGKTNDTVPGIGLGLYISSEIIRRQGGSMWVESEQGKGSLFCFTLLKRQVQVKQETQTLIQEEEQHE